jgi:hypothetical protein
VTPSCRSSRGNTRPAACLGGRTNIGSALPFAPYSLSGFAPGYPVAGALLGAAVGALLAGPLADRFGRESLLIADALIYALGAMSASIEGVQGHLVDGEDVGRLVRGGQCGRADDGDGGHRDAVLVAPDQIADGVGDGQVAGDRH